MGELGSTLKMVRLLGAGAFSEVYLVEDGAGRHYACKVSGHTELLAREAASHRRICHPLFPKFVQFWKENGKAYLLMECIEGENLKKAAEMRGGFAARQAADIGAQLAEGLFYLHQLPEPVVFRDVKPENVMLARNGTARLLDFGCACQAGKSVDIAGSPGFGAPEQFVTDSVQTAAADVYGLGRTLEKILEEGERGILRRIIRRCVEERPEDRLGDMRELAGMLHSLARDGERSLSGRQRAVLKGDLRLIKNICY